MIPKILAFAASTRTDSLNQQALDIAAAAAREAGAEVTEISLRDYSMPLYDGDLEKAKGVPDAVIALGQLMSEHQALLIASPEYNGFFTPLYKNTLDWLSRLEASPFAGKTAALLGASPGGFGGIRGLPHAKLLLENLGVLVLPKSAGVPKAPAGLDDPTSRSHQSLVALGRELTETAKKLAS